MTTIAHVVPIEQTMKVLLIAPALLGLTHAVEDAAANGGGRVAFQPGKVMVANLSYFAEGTFNTVDSSIPAVGSDSQPLPGTLAGLSAQRSAVSHYGTESTDYGVRELLSTDAAAYE